MKIVMRILGFASGQPCPVLGMYLKSFDPESNDGRGLVTFTEKIREAKMFDKAEDAFAYYNTVPKCRPTRPDGQPNKPLTASHWEFLQVMEGG